MPHKNWRVYFSIVKWSQRSWHFSQRLPEMTSGNGRCAVWALAGNGGRIEWSGSRDSYHFNNLAIKGRRNIKVCIEKKGSNGHSSFLNSCSHQFGSSLTISQRLFWLKRLRTSIVKPMAHQNAHRPWSPSSTQLSRPVLLSEMLSFPSSCVIK